MLGVAKRAIEVGMLRDEAPWWLKGAAIVLIGGSILASTRPAIDPSRFTGSWARLPGAVLKRLPDCGYARGIAAIDTMNKPPEQRDYLVACADPSTVNWTVRIVTPDRISNAAAYPYAWRLPREGTTFLS